MGICSFPLWIAIVWPIIAGIMVDARDQVFIISFFSFVLSLSQYLDFSFFFSLFFILYIRYLEKIQTTFRKLASQKEALKNPQISSGEKFIN